MTAVVAIREVGGNLLPGNQPNPLVGSEPSEISVGSLFVTGGADGLFRAGGKITDPSGGSRVGINIGAACVRARLQYAALAGYTSFGILCNQADAGLFRASGGNTGYMLLIEPNGWQLYKLAPAGNTVILGKIYGTATAGIAELDKNPTTNVITITVPGFAAQTITDNSYSTGNFTVIETLLGGAREFLAWEGHVWVSAAPDAPTDIAPTTIDITTMGLRITKALTGQPPATLKLRYRPEGATVWTSTAAQSSVDFTLTGLAPATGYEVQAIATNAVGDSAPGTLEVFATNNLGTGTWVAGASSSLEGNAAAAPQATGTISAGAALSGNAAGSSQAAGTIGGGAALSGAAGAAPGASGTAVVGQTLSGAAAAQPGSQGTLQSSAPIVLGGDTTANAQGSADLTVPPAYDRVTEYLGQALYATIADLVRRYGEPEIVQLSDKARLNLIGFETVLRALSDASIEMDSYLGVRYRLPIAPVPAIANLICSEIARYRLYEDAATQEVRQRYLDAVTRLKDIAAGKITLGIAESAAGGAVAPSSAGLPQIASPPASDFGSEGGY